MMRARLARISSHDGVDLGPQFSTRAGLGVNPGAPFYYRLQAGVNANDQGVYEVQG